MQNTPLEDEIGDKAAKELLASERAKQAKYTPAPWLVFKDPVGRVSRVFCNNAPVICSFLGAVRRYCSNEEAAANAQLISAAPELLEALQEVVRISDRDHSAWIKAKAAIAKALGVQA